MRNFAPGIEEVRRFPEPIPWTVTSGDFFFIGGGLFFFFIVNLPIV